DEAIQSSLLVLDCFAALAMTLLALRQEADHRVGKGVRLFDIGNMRGVENRKTGARDIAADQFGSGKRRRHVVTARDYQHRAFDLWQQRALVERAQVRRLHVKLLYRPLLEAVARVPA